MSDARFSRSKILYGDAAQERFANAHVAVCGIGAVGGFALEALARVGVGHFSLYDFDVVDISNINRQICALSSTVGKAKAEIAQARVSDINPSAKIEVHKKFLDADSVGEIMAAKPDVVIDAIDSLSSKVALIASALGAGVPIVSSMGAARKTDVSQILCAKLSKSFNCPMAAKIRKRLRQQGVKAENMCVFSKEIPSEESHLQSGGEGQSKIIGSSPVITGIFGLMLADLAIKEILKQRT